MKGTGGDIASFLGSPISEAPYDLVTAVNFALSVISWHENLPQEEVPPRHLWWSEDLLEEWFQGVRERRKEKTEGGKNTRSSYETAQDVPMTENELAAQYRPS